MDNKTETTSGNAPESGNSQPVGKVMPALKVVADAGSGAPKITRASVKTTESGRSKKLERAVPNGEKAFSVRFRLFVAFLAIGVLVVAGAGWAGTAKLAGAIIAQGAIVVERHVKKVQHLDGGIVSEIKVGNGDFAKAGDVLIRLDDTRHRAELGVIQSQLVELTGRKARLVAERDGLAAIAFPAEFESMGPATARVRDGETRLFDSNLVSRESNRDQLRQRVGQQEKEIRALTSQRDAKVNELKLIRKEAKLVKKLLGRKLTSVTRLYALEREATRIDGEQSSLTAQIARSQGRISEIRLQILAVDQTTKRDTQKEIRDIEAKIAELTERKFAISDKMSRVELKAPVSGVVHQLAVHTVGGVVTPAEPVMLIVPGNDRLAIEARILPNDIDQVRANQEVRVRLSAFNQRATSELHGHLLSVSADVSQDPRSGASYYTARVEIGKESMKKIVDWKLVPGMPVEIFITTGERTALSYLAKPITDQLARAFRDD